MPTPKPLNEEMLWSNYAPSKIAESILCDCLGRVIHPSPPSCVRDKLRFEYHLKAHGQLRYFSVDEITTPNDKAKAKAVGYTEFVPPGHTWGVVLYLVYLANELRHAAGSPVTMKNLWRPDSYNDQVAVTDIDSDHPNACGTDLQFKSHEDLALALEWLCEHIEETDNAARFSVGLGYQTLHVGILSPNDSRHWTYGSWGKRAVPDTIRRLKHWPS